MELYMNPNQIQESNQIKIVSSPSITATGIILLKIQPGIYNLEQSGINLICEEAKLAATLKNAAYQSYSNIFQGMCRIRLDGSQIYDVQNQMVIQEMNYFQNGWKQCNREVIQAAAAGFFNGYQQPVGNFEDGAAAATQFISQSYKFNDFFPYVFGKYLKVEKQMTIQLELTELQNLAVAETTNALTAIVMASVVVQLFLKQEFNKNVDFMCKNVQLIQENNNQSVISFKPEKMGQIATFQAILIHDGFTNLLLQPAFQLTKVYIKKNTKTLIKSDVPCDIMSQFQMYQPNPCLQNIIYLDEPSEICDFEFQLTPTTASKINVLFVY